MDEEEGCWEGSTGGGRGGERGKGGEAQKRRKGEGGCRRDSRAGWEKMGTATEEEKEGERQ